MSPISDFQNELPEYRNGHCPLLTSLSYVDTFSQKRAFSLCRNCCIMFVVLSVIHMKYKRTYTLSPKKYTGTFKSNDL